MERRKASSVGGMETCVRKTKLADQRVATAYELYSIGREVNNLQLNLISYITDKSSVYDSVSNSPV